MIVISDTTPVISLLKADRLELLRELYGTVLMPEAVYKELTENPVYIKEAEIIKKTHFLSVARVENTTSVNILRAIIGLDAGESEALILYGEQRADLLLMDERKGRSVAKQLNIMFMGTVGILMLAFDKNLLQAEEVNLCLHSMITNGIRLDKKICNMVMSHVGLDTRY